MNINTAWQELRERINTCRNCGLCDGRINPVIGEGPVSECRTVIIGEAPGQTEDEQGRPFVGKAGQLLTGILENGGGIPRSSVYITNTVKCRPPGNREPNAGEIESCREFLEAQLALLHPDIVVTLGNVPTKALTHTSSGITSLHGKPLNWRGIILFPMYHPSFLLRNESNSPGSPRYQTWQDVIALKKLIDNFKGGR